MVLLAWPEKQLCTMILSLFVCHIFLDSNLGDFSFEPLKTLLERLLEWARSI